MKLFLLKCDANEPVFVAANNVTRAKHVVRDQYSTVHSVYEVTLVARESHGIVSHEEAQSLVTKGVWKKIESKLK